MCAGELSLGARECLGWGGLSQPSTIDLSCCLHVPRRAMRFCVLSVRFDSPLRAVSGTTKQLQHTKHLQSTTKQLQQTTKEQQQQHTQRRSSSSRSRPPSASSSSRRPGACRAPSAAAPSAAAAAAADHRKPG
ncbi:unnamed protein product [Durusdinium trenchii]|uniref:Uncharacterized protein n=1 Tax=Durusdinium trenchii TaxID=1381693 RepID=A0ABP0S0R6_9DINO